MSAVIVACFSVALMLLCGIATMLIIKMRMSAKVTDVAPAGISSSSTGGRREKKAGSASGNLWLSGSPSAASTPRALE